MKQSYDHINLVAIVAIYLREIEYYYLIREYAPPMPLDAYHIDKMQGILSMVFNTYWYIHMSPYI